MITAILDNTTRVEVVGIDEANAIILTNDGDDIEVCVDRLTDIEHQELDLTPLEW
jgi:hypothetical protein